MQVWIECPQFHWIGVQTTHKLMHKHVGKHAKMQRKPNRWCKASKANISTLHGAEKDVNQEHQHHRGISRKWLHPINLRRDQCNHTNISPQRAQSMAKPRSREANMQIKHRSKQANMDMHKGNDPNPLIQAQVYECRPRPRDLDLHPIERAKKQEREISGDKKSSTWHSNQHRSKHTSMIWST